MKIAHWPWKRICIGFIGLLVTLCGGFKLSWEFAGIGLVILLSAILFNIEEIIKFLIAYVEAKTGIDVVKNTGKMTSNKVKDTYPDIDDDAIHKIEESSSLDAIATTTATAVSNYFLSGGRCRNCESLNVNELEWLPEFEKSLVIPSIHISFIPHTPQF